MYETIFKLQAKTLKALAHSRRLEIVQLLQTQELSVTDIYQMLDLPQANISQHLNVLKTAQILKQRREGKQIFYQIDNPEIIQALDLIRQMLIKKHQDSDLADELTLKMTDLVPVTRDPVCGMRVSPKTASFATQYQNQTYYFCASGCHKKFSQSQEQYVQSE